MLLDKDGNVIAGTGLPGETGPQGEQGPQGPEGPQGPAGANGADAEIPITNVDTATATNMTGITVSTTDITAGETEIDQIYIVYE